MILATSFLLASQAVADPYMIERKQGARSYPFCLAFTDPFPDDAPAYRVATVTRTTKVWSGLWKRAKAGTYLLVAGEREGYAAVFDPRTGYDGCITAAALRSRPPAPVNDRRRWIGEWQKIYLRRINKDAISIRPGKSGRLHVLGDATWKYAEGAPDESANFGGFDGRAPVRGGVIALDDLRPMRCRVRLQLVGAYLVVFDRDAESCNGNNVSFSGVYRRVSARRR